MSFDAAETSFRQFSKCILVEDLAELKLEFKDAWLQNVVSAQEFLGQDNGGGENDSKEPTNDDAYIVTGIVRVAPAGGSTKDHLTVLVIRKVLDRYKVVNWVTNIGQEREYSLEELSLGLSNLYEGKCSW